MVRELRAGGRLGPDACHSGRPRIAVIDPMPPKHSLIERTSP